MRNAAGEVLPRKAEWMALGIERGCTTFIRCKASLVRQRGQEGGQEDVHVVIWRSLLLCAHKGSV